MLTFHCQLPEEVELVWDDGVAPEAAIDFDAPHISGKEVLLSFLAGLSGIAGVYGLVYLSDPESKSPAVPRSAVLSKQGILVDLGLAEFTTEEEYAGASAAHDEEE